MSKHYSHDDINRLRELVREGCTVKREVDDLNGGLNDTVKAVAEEMGINAGILKKLINTAYKNNAQDVKAQHTELEDLIDTLGL